MQPFFAIYNKGASLQFAFNDQTLHPHYIGAEMPIGQSLGAVINIKEDEANKVFNELIKAYIKFLDTKADEAYKNNLSDIEADFYAARRRYNTRVSRNPHLRTEFEYWKIKAREKLTAYRNQKISADEFKNWFMNDEWTKLN